MKGYSTFPRVLGLKLHRLFSVISGTLIRLGRSYSSEEMQAGYSIAPANWAGDERVFFMSVINKSLRR